jgi:hypothetical protein
MRAMRGALIASVVTISLVQPALAEDLVYGLYGDISTFTPTDLVSYAPGVVRGTMTMEDSGNGSPVLKAVSSWTKYEIDAHGDVTCCAGTKVDAIVDTQIRVTGLPVTGTGSHFTSINFGPVSGYFQEGGIYCETFPGPSCLGCSACTPAGLVEGGWAPPVPLTSTVFNTDPTVFSSDGSSFVSSTIKATDLNPSINVTAHSQQKGHFTLVPSLPLVGLGGLAALLLVAGAHLISRRLV